MTAHTFGYDAAYRLSDALGKLLIPSSDTPGLEHRNEVARQVIVGWPRTLRYSGVSFRSRVFDVIRHLVHDPETVGEMVASGVVPFDYFARARITTVGIREGERDEDLRLTVGVEDLRRRATDTVLKLLGGASEVPVLGYQTGRIVVHEGPPFGVVSPLRPGCSVSARKSAWGTLGAVVRWRDSGEIGILSNAHVLDHPESEDVMHPGVGEPGANAQRIGYRHIAILPNKDTINASDAAVAKLDGDIRHDPDLLVVDQGFGYPTHQFDEGIPVAKVGAASGLSHGTVVQRRTRVAAWYANNRLMKFGDQIEIVGEDQKPFSIPGDSGSLVWSRDNREPVGLLFSGQGNRSWASPVKGPLESFGV